MLMTKKHFCKQVATVDSEESISFKCKGFFFLHLTPETQSVIIKKSLTINRKKSLMA